MTPRLAAGMLIVGLASFELVAGLLILAGHGWLPLWLAVALLAPGAFSILILMTRLRIALERERAAGSAPTAPASLHTPPSFPAPARDAVHRPGDLPARHGR